MRGIVAFLVVVTTGLVSGSAIPMWEFLSRGEKVSELLVVGLRLSINKSVRYAPAMQQQGRPTSGGLERSVFPLLEIPKCQGKGGR